MAKNTGTDRPKPKAAAKSAPSSATDGGRAAAQENPTESPATDTAVDSIRAVSKADAATESPATDTAGDGTGAVPKADAATESPATDTAGDGAGAVPKADAATESPATDTAGDGAGAVPKADAATESPATDTAGDGTGAVPKADAATESPTTDTAGDGTGAVPKADAATESPATDTAGDGTGAVPKADAATESPTTDTAGDGTGAVPKADAATESPATDAAGDSTAQSSKPASAPKKKTAAVELAVDAVIEARELRKTFNGLVSVDRVSFRVRRGEVLGFLGPNGAGKTTTMRMIAGFLQPTSGTAFVGGLNVRHDRIRVCRQLGYLAEGTPAYGDMNVKAYLDFIAEIHLLDAHARKERKQAVIEALDLESVLGQRIHTLSKGFKRRVGLAQAIVHDPTALILDEPTDGLDPNQKQQVHQLIRRLSHDKGIVISTHILEEVSSVCSRVLILDRGRILIDETPEQMIARSPRHGALTVLFSGPVPSGAVEACKRHDDIGDASVETLEGREQLTVVPGRARGALLPALQQTLANQGWEAQDIRPRPGQLDEVFRQLTADTPAQ